MRNEQDHADLRATLTTLRRGARFPKVRNVISRHYCNKLRYALERFRARKNIVVQPSRSKCGTSIVSSAARVLRKSLKRKQPQRNAAKLTVGKGLKSFLLNRKRKEHKALHGSVPLAKFRELEEGWRQEFESLSQDERQQLQERYSCQVSAAIELHSLVKCRGKRRRLLGSVDVGEGPAAEPELTP